MTDSSNSIDRKPPEVLPAPPDPSLQTSHPPQAQAPTGNETFERLLEQQDQEMINNTDFIGDINSDELVGDDDELGDIYAHESHESDSSDSDLPDDVLGRQAEGEHGASLTSPSPPRQQRHSYQRIGPQETQNNMSTQVDMSSRHLSMDLLGQMVLGPYSPVMVGSQELPPMRTSGANSGNTATEGDTWIERLPSIDTLGIMPPRPPQPPPEPQEQVDQGETVLVDSESDPEILTDSDEEEDEEEPVEPAAGQKRKNTQDRFDESSVIGGTESSTGEQSGEKTTALFKCSICLEKPDPSVFLKPCGHVFCESCALASVEASRKCPICRHNVSYKGVCVLQFCTKLINPPAEDAGDPGHSSQEAD